MEQITFTVANTDKSIETAVLEHTGTQLLVSVGGYGNLPLTSVGPGLKEAALRAARKKGWVQPINHANWPRHARIQELAHNADFDEEGYYLRG